MDSYRGFSLGGKQDGRYNNTMAFPRDDKNQHYMNATTVAAMTSMVPDESPIEASMLPKPYNLDNASNDSRDDFKL